MGRFLLEAEIASDDFTHDFVGARPDLGDAVFVHIAVAAVDLYAVVEDSAGIYPTPHHSGIGMADSRFGFLQSGPVDSMEGVLVGRKPFGLIAGARKKEPVFHDHFRFDLGDAGDHLCDRLPGDL